MYTLKELRKRLVIKKVMDKYIDVTPSKLQLIHETMEYGFYWDKTEKMIDRIIKNYDIIVNEYIKKS